MIEPDYFSMTPEQKLAAIRREVLYANLDGCGYCEVEAALQTIANILCLRPTDYDQAQAEFDAQ